MDHFENYFKENRLRLDVEDLDPDCWKRIDTSFKKQRQHLFVRRLSVAASIVLVLAIGSVIYLNQNRNETVQNQMSPLSYTNLAEQETSYLQVINIKVNEIKKQSVPVAYKSMFDDFVHQLQIIDQQYDLYKKELDQHGYSDELIQQIIYNYQLKLSVLQMLQMEMTKINNLSKHNGNENTNIQLNI